MFTCSRCYARDECSDFGRTCEHFRTDDSETAARAWLRDNRCRTCARRLHPACPFMVTKTRDGWRCSGYKRETRQK